VRGIDVKGRKTGVKKAFLVVFYVENRVFTTTVFRLVGTSPKSCTKRERTGLITGFHDRTG